MSFSEQGFTIKWVDDTHALGVFASEIAGEDKNAIDVSLIVCTCIENYR